MLQVVEEVHKPHMQHVLVVDFVEVVPDKLHVMCKSKYVVQSVEKNVDFEARLRDLVRIIVDVEADVLAQLLQSHNRLHAFHTQ